MGSMEFNPEFDLSNIGELDDDEVLMLAMSMLEAYDSMENNEDYEPNPAQMRKFIAAYATIHDLIGDGFLEIETRLEPKECVGGITAHFNLMWLTWENVYRLARMLCDTSALSIDATLDGKVCFSFNIPGVFRKKEKTE